MIQQNNQNEYQESNSIALNLETLSVSFVFMSLILSCCMFSLCLSSVFSKLFWIVLRSLIGCC